jgi:hypothetical protein
VQLVSEQSRLLLPQSIVCLTTDVDFQKNTYNTPAHAEFYEVNSLPSYDDTKGGIILMSTTDTLDVLTYDKSNLTQPAFEDGVAWERNSSTAAGEVLWNTAASLVNYGTPGYANSHVGYLGKVSPQDLQINELLFNSATGGSDFVEIYNNSPEAINISNILVGKVAKGETEITALAHLLGDRDTLKSGELLAISGNILFNKQYYQTPPEAKLFNFPATPTFDDTEGEVVLMHRDGTVIERFHYYDDYHFVALSDKNGVSLERISRNVTVNQATNWHSAASTVNYATPGYENSMREELLGGDEEVSLEYTTFTPNNDGDKDVLAINYSLNVQGANVRADIFDATGLLVKNLELNQLVGAEKGTFFWDGTTNDNERALIGMYVVLIEVQVVETGKKQRYKKVCVLGDKM